MAADLQKAVLLSLSVYARGVTIVAVAHRRDVESPRVRRGSNTPAQKLGSSAVFPSFMGVAAGGNSAAPAASSLSHSSSVAVPAGLDTTAGSNAAMHASFERPTTAAVSSGMTAGSSLGMAAGMAGMFG